MGTQLHPLRLAQRGTAPSPQFSAHVCCGQMARWIKMPLGMEVGLCPAHIVLDRNPGPPPRKRHSSPHFLAHVYCDQMAGWIKMPLGTEVGVKHLYYCVAKCCNAWGAYDGQSLQLVETWWAQNVICDECRVWAVDDRMWAEMTECEL